MNNPDTEYFAMRAREERALSLTADDERVSAAHADMAARYENLAKQFKIKVPPLRIVKNDARPA